MSNDLPYDPKARRDTPLAQKLKARIRAEGRPLGLPEYIQAALWDAEYGYYRRAQVIGSRGDFITAPEISQVFGELLGLWAAVVWQQMGQPRTLTVMEYGPGRGTLMRDMLRAAKIAPDFAQALRVHLVDASAALVEQQKTALGDCGFPVTYVTDATVFPDGPIIAIANEFIDALPIDQIEKTEQAWMCRGVGLDARGELDFELSQINQRFDDREALFQNAPIGSVVEQMPSSFASTLPSKAPFAALCIDYGTERPCLGDSLQAVRGHAFEHPLCSPGEADLSAHVNFASVADDARRAGFATDGPVTQAEFLGALGIMQRASRLMAANPAKANEIEMGVARLMAPNGMGTRFKVLGIRTQGLPPLPGFPTTLAQ